MKVRILLFFLLVLFAFAGFARCIDGNCANGIGRAKLDNGDVYTGDWKQGLMDGQGQYTYKSGAVYSGMFQRGKLNGQGTMRYPDGAYYQGEWSNNRKHGAGKLVTPSGKTRQGRWAVGKFVGAVSSNSLASQEKPTPVKPVVHRQEYTISTAKPTSSSSPFRDCNTVFCEEGFGRYTYRDGAVYEGEFEEGKPSGEGVVHYTNGDVYTGGWDMTGPDGAGAYMFANGKRVAGVWDYGKLVRRTYAETGPSPTAKPSTKDSPLKLTTKASDGKATMYAVVVGIGRYTAMKTLNYTDDDAYQMYAFLKSPEGGALSDDQVEILVDERATRTNIELALSDKLGQADADDIVVFYFSGHGVDGYFVPVDFDGIHNLLSHKRVEELLASSSAKHKLVLADACHSGGLLAAREMSASSSRLYDAFLNSTGGTALLLSSRSEEVSLEANNLRSGVFSHYVMRGMKGEADTDRNRIVTVDELHRFVYEGVREYTGYRQTPVMSGSFDRSMPVASLR
ncbi:MAG: caspase family protein [Saprospiraceae bacterium]